MPRKKLRKSRSEIIDSILNNWIRSGFIQAKDKTKFIVQLQYVSKEILKVIDKESTKLLEYSGKDKYGVL